MHSSTIQYYPCKFNLVQWICQQDILSQSKTCSRRRLPRQSEPNKMNTNTLYIRDLEQYCRKWFYRTPIDCKAEGICSSCQCHKCPKGIPYYLLEAGAEHRLQLFPECTDCWSLTFRNLLWFQFEHSCMFSLSYLLYIPTTNQCTYIIKNIFRL